MPEPDQIDDQMAAQRPRNTSISESPWTRKAASIALIAYARSVFQDPPDIDTSSWLDNLEPRSKLRLGLFVWSFDSSQTPDCSQELIDSISGDQTEELLENIWKISGYHLKGESCGDFKSNFYDTLVS